MDLMHKTLNVPNLAKVTLYLLITNVHYPLSPTQWDTWKRLTSEVGVVAMPPRPRTCQRSASTWQRSSTWAFAIQQTTNTSTTNTPRQWTRRMEQATERAMGEAAPARNLVVRIIVGLQVVAPSIATRSRAWGFLFFREPYQTLGHGVLRTSTSNLQIARSQQ